MLAYVEYVAGRMQHLGIKRGMRVAIHVPNGVTAAVVVTACWKAGAVVVPVSMHLPLSAARAHARDMGCQAAVTSTGSLVLPPSRPSLSMTELDAPPQSMFGGIRLGDLGLDLTQPASIVLTSGSTGQPKGVLHSLANHYYSALGSSHNIPFGEQDTWLASLPLHHVSGLSLIMRALLQGGTLCYPDPDVPTVLARPGITHTSLVPVQLSRLLNDAAARRGLQRLKAVLVGGQACPDTLVARCQVLNIRVCLTYGLTETASQVATTRPDAVIPPGGCAGHVLPYRELMIADSGEIWVRGRTLSPGYVTRQGVIGTGDADGWLHTRDVGQVDSDGCLWIQGRMDTMFISGGENIFPEEIEKALLSDPRIEQCCVVPVEDTTYGHRPVAFVKIRPHHCLDRRSLDPVLDTLESFKHPDVFYGWPSDLSWTGKPDRVALLQRLRCGQILQLG